MILIKLLTSLSLVMTIGIMGVFLLRLGEFAFNGVAFVLGLIYLGGPLLFCLGWGIQRFLFLGLKQRSIWLGVLCYSGIAISLVEWATPFFTSGDEWTTMANWPLVRLLVYLLLGLDLLITVIVMKKISS